MSRNAPIEEPHVTSNSRVLVLAPHLDDPIIGCGGTMSKLAKRGAHIKVLYMTDTSYNGYPSPYCELVQMDYKRAEEMLDKLHCYESEHLDLPARGMRCDTSTIRNLRRAINYYSPDLLFIPSYHDKHPDNTVTGLLAAHALKGYGSRLTLYSYDVWGGLFPNTKVEISKEMVDKLIAFNLRVPNTRPTNEISSFWVINTVAHPDKQDENCCEPYLRQECEEFVTLTGRPMNLEL